MLFHTYTKLPKFDQSDWNSRVVSTIHAVWATYGAVIIMFDLPEYSWFSESTYANLFFPTLVGYLAYDLLVVLAHRNLWDKGTFLHHTVGIACFCVVMSFNIAHFIANLWYITEATTPFVNQRWFFDKTGMKHSPIFVVNGFIMWLGFLLLRIGIAPAIFITLYRDWSRVVLRLGYPMICTVVVMMSSMIVTNSYWFYLISRGLYKAVRSQLYGDATTTQSNSNPRGKKE